MAHRLAKILESQADVLANHSPSASKGFRAKFTWAAIDAVCKASDDRCAICGVEETKRYHALDHDHKTGRLRGILCHSCNVGLGHFKDDPALLAKAIAYLDRADTSPGPLAIDLSRPDHPQAHG